MITISDTTHEERVYSLIEQIFEQNSITYDFSDYSVTSVEQNTCLSSNIFNSLMKLSPINTNLQLPNLTLGYNRSNLGNIVTNNNLKIVTATRTSTAYSLLKELNAQLLSANLIIDESDVHNTFVANQPSPDNAFLTLHALPESFFYISQARVPIELFNYALRGAVKVTITDK